MIFITTQKVLNPRFEGTTYGAVFRLKVGYQEWFSGEGNAMGWGPTPEAAKSQVLKAAVEMRDQLNELIENNK